MLSDFKAFILRGNVVDLAVGVVIGAAFSGMVHAFVADILTPLIGIPGKTNFSQLTIRVSHSVFRYGDFANAVISFFLVAIAVYFGVVRPINTLMGRLSRQPKIPSTKLCTECLSAIPVKATRCAYCTSLVADADADAAPAGEGSTTSH